MLISVQNVWYCDPVNSGMVAALAAMIHVKLTGEGDFGPVDLECAIPPARLPVVMAALFGQAPAVSGGIPSRPVAGVNPNPNPNSVAPGIAAMDVQAGANIADVHPAATGDVNAASAVSGAADAGTTGMPGVLRNEGSASDKASIASSATVSGQGDGAPSGMSGMGSPGAVDGVLEYGGGYATSAMAGMEPGTFITHFMGTLGDLVGRLQPRGFAETILIAAIWLHYRESRTAVTRDDIRRILRLQEHLRMPRNFSRDFHVALSRGYLEPVDTAGGFAVSGKGYQWFRSECIK